MLCATYSDCTVVVRRPGYARGIHTQPLENWSLMIITDKKWIPAIQLGATWPARFEPPFYRLACLLE